MKWVLVIYMTMNSAPQLNPNIFLGTENFATHHKCAEGAKKYGDNPDGYRTVCVQGPLRWQTPAEWNAERGIK